MATKILLSVIASIFFVSALYFAVNVSLRAAIELGPAYILVTIIIIISLFLNILIAYKTIWD